jgi:hypothetical protein
MASQIDIACGACWEQIPLVDADAETFFCPHCATDYRFVICAACESVNQVPGKPARATCVWCASEIRLRPFRRTEVCSAEDWRTELDERGCLDADGVWVGGFTLLGGSGFDVETGATCSVLSLPDAVDVRAEVGGTGVVTIPYERITDIEIAGGAVTRRGGFIGGGFGLEGAAEGMLVASLLNSLTTKTAVDTGLAIASVDGELLLNHNKIPRDDLRRRLSVMFTRFNAARHQGRDQPGSATDPMSQLERLAALHERGILTAEEFEAARAAQVKRLTEGH